MKIVSLKSVNPVTAKLNGTQGRVVGLRTFKRDDKVQLKVFVVDESQGNSKEEPVGTYLAVPATFNGNILEPMPSKMQVMLRGRLRTVRPENNPHIGQFEIVSGKYSILNKQTVFAPITYTNGTYYLPWRPLKLERVS